MAEGAPASPKPLRHVVITGRSGFIGRRLAQRLEGEGVSVSGVSRANGIDVTRGFLPLEGVDHVYHLGGLSFVPDAWADPSAYYFTNTYGTVRVLDQCRQAGIPVTFVSTYVYGSSAPIPVSEKTPPNPNNPYAFSKLAAEDACRFYARTFGLEVSILRLFNAYGPGQGASFLIPTIARQAVDRDCREIVVADLSPRRDFIHVDDVVDALRAAPRLPRGEAFNVGSGRSHSVQNVIEACLSAANVAKPFRARDERRANEVPDVVADISALSAAIGWRPQIAFEAGIRTVIEAMKPC